MIYFAWYFFRILNWVRSTRGLPWGSPSLSRYFNSSAWDLRYLIFHLTVPSISAEFWSEIWQNFVVGKYNEIWQNFLQRNSVKFLIKIRCKKTAEFVQMESSFKFFEVLSTFFFPLKFSQLRVLSAWTSPTMGILSGHIKHEVALIWGSLELRASTWASISLGFFDLRVSRVEDLSFHQLEIPPTSDRFELAPPNLWIYSTVFILFE